MGRLRNRLLFVIKGRPWPLASLLDLMAVLGERCSLPAVAAAVEAFSLDCALKGKMMTLTDAQLSRLTAALNNQLEADKQFAAKTKNIANPTSLVAEAAMQYDASAEALLDARLSPPSLAPTAPPELDKQFDAAPEPHLSHDKDRECQLDTTAAPTGLPPAVSPPLVPRPLEDRYAKGWADAWDFIRPQLHELHRRYILTGTALLSANRWIKWLPIICFLCTLFGFALGWCWGTLVTSRSWNIAQKLEITPKAAGDRGDKMNP